MERKCTEYSVELDSFCYSGSVVGADQYVGPSLDYLGKWLLLGRTFQSRLCGEGSIGCGIAGFPRFEWVRSPLRSPLVLITSFLNLISECLRQMILGTE